MDPEPLQLNIKNKENICLWILAAKFINSHYCSNGSIRQCNFFKNKTIKELNLQNINKSYSFYGPGVITNFYFMDIDKLFIENIHMIVDHPTSGIYEYKYSEITQSQINLNSSILNHLISK